MRPIFMGCYTVVILIQLKVLQFCTDDICEENTALVHAHSATARVCYQWV
jgi:hypothetical protein